jgi:hypothetical protein
MTETRTPPDPPTCCCCAFSHDLNQPSAGAVVECRRHAPSGVADRLWPLVPEEAWCGEFKPWGDSEHEDGSPIYDLPWVR